MASTSVISSSEARLTPPQNQISLDYLDKPKRSPTKSVKQILSILFLAIALAVFSTISFHASTVYQTTQHFVPLDIPEEHGAKQQTKADHKSPIKNCTTTNGPSCFKWNSRAWLDGPRLGNAPLQSEQFAMALLLDTPPLLSEGSSLPLILQQSLCHERSRFMNWTDDGSDDKSIRFWSLRLIYLAFHVQQHKPAAREARERQSCSGACTELLRRRQIGNFDYECPDAKFLVVPMGRSGLGAVMRLGVVNALIAGFVTDRTVIFLSNSPVGPRFLRRPWTQASCDRRDLQCFYLPVSPCVLTENEIEEAYELQKSEKRAVFSRGELPPEHNNTRVIIADFVMRPQKFPENFRPRMLTFVTGFIDQLSEASPHDPRIPMLRQAAQIVVEGDQEDPLRPFYYSGCISKVHHAAVFYAMRPNQLAARKLDDMMKHVFPTDFDSDYAFGLPIRDSDKCKIESECLSFDQYMKLMGQVWKKNQGLISTSGHSRGGSDGAMTRPIGSIILTSESEKILQAREKFENNSTLKSSVPFDFRFVTNEEDVMQGTGLPMDFGMQGNVTADDVMLSTVGAIKAQLMARFTVGNCCSNFHLLLFDFLRDGCGASRDNIGQCLQENEDPEFRVCCEWSKTDECQQKKKDRIFPTGA